MIMEKNVIANIDTISLHQRMSSVRYAAGTLLILLIGHSLYAIFAYDLIRSIYEGTCAIEYFNGFIAPSAGNSLTHYLNIADRILLLFDIYFLTAVALIYKARAIELPKRLMSLVAEHSRTMGICAALVVGFSAIYIIGGQYIKASSALDVYDVLFEADPKRVVRDFTMFAADHSKTSIHPLYVLIVNPIGSMLSNLLGSNINATMLLTSCIGGINAGIAFLIFKHLIGNTVNSLLLAIIFALSMSQMFFGMLPEAHILEGLSLLTTYALFLICLKHKKIYTGLWIAAGIFTLAITITNFFQTLCCFTVLTIAINRTSGRSNHLEAVGNVASYTARVLLITVALAMLQNVIYPSSRFFFIPAAITDETRHVDFAIFAHPLIAIIDIIKHFSLTVFIAPLPKAFTMPQNQATALTFARAWQYGVAGYLAAALWLVLLGATAIRTFRDKHRNTPLLIAITVCLAFNLILHCFYGFNDIGQHEPFIYGCNFAFLVFILIAMNLKSTGWYITIFLAVMAVSAGINNIMVLRNIVSFYP